MYGCVSPSLGITCTPPPLHGLANRPTSNHGPVRIASPPLSRTGQLAPLALVALPCPVDHPLPRSAVRDGRPDTLPASHAPTPPSSPSPSVARPSVRPSVRPLRPPRLPARPARRQLVWATPLAHRGSSPGPPTMGTETPPPGGRRPGTGRTGPSPRWVAARAPEGPGGRGGRATLPRASVADVPPPKASRRSAPHPTGQPHIPSGPGPGRFYTDSPTPFG